MIQLNQSGAVLVSSQEEMRTEFATHNCVLLPQLISSSLLKQLQRQVAAARMETKFEGAADDQFGKVLFVPQTEPALFVFNLLMNNRRLFQVMEEITQCIPIGNFFGRMHQSMPGGDHEIDWHGDNADNRLLGLTVYLSEADHEGGVFQLRRKATEEILCEIPHKQAGDAFVFRISPDLQHRLTRVENGGPRIVGVGWFRSQPDFATFANRYLRFSMA